jgi:hypothetical protein
MFKLSKIPPLGRNDSMIVGMTVADGKTCVGRNNANRLQQQLKQII